MVGLIGRQHEIARMDAAYTRGARLFWVHGPAGEGKTALLRHWLVTRAHTLDLHSLDAHTEMVWLDGWDPARDDELIDALRRWPRARVAVSTRQAPSLALRAATREPLVMLLGGLDDEATTQLLHGLPTEHANTLRALAHGHALTLTVLRGAHDTTDRRRLLGELLHDFVGDALSTQERLALEAIAPLRFVSEAQLQRATGSTPTAAHELFARLRQLSFVQAEPLGLSLHPALREIFLEDLAWRAPERTRSLVQSELPILRAELTQSEALRARAIEILADLIVRAPGAWVEPASLFRHARPPRPEDHAEILELVEMHEGAESAAVCAQWLRLDPQRCSIVRGANGVLLALAVRARVDRHAPPAVDDPMLTRVLAALPEEHVRFVLINRFLIGRGSYQTLGGALISALAVWVHDTFTTPHQAHLTVIRDAPMWAALLSSGVFSPIESTRTRFGDHEYVAFGGAISSPESTVDGVFGFVAQHWGLLRTAMPSELARAVHEAMHALGDPHGLTATLLARMLGVDGLELQRRLHDALAQLEQMPDGRRARQALLARAHTRGSQDDAAASVAMSLATYKRMRKRAEQRLGELLWRTRV